MEDNWRAAVRSSFLCGFQTHTNSALPCARINSPLSMTDAAAALKTSYSHALESCTFVTTMYTVSLARSLRRSVRTINTRLVHCQAAVLSTSHPRPAGGCLYGRMHTPHTHIRRRLGGTGGQRRAGGRADGRSSFVVDVGFVQQPTPNESHRERAGEPTASSACLAPGLGRRRTGRKEGRKRAWND